MLLVLAGCTTSSPSPSASDGVPAGQPIRIDLGVEVSPDNRVVTLRFIGGPILPVTDPCNTEYAGWAKPADDVLQVAVVLMPNPVDLPTGAACAAAGFEREVEVTLEEPFVGAIARDLPFGADIQIARRPGVAECSLTNSLPHQAPELESQLPNMVAGGELETWSAAGWCWVELSLGPEGVAKFRPIATAQSLRVERMEYATARRSGPDQPPNFIYGLRYPLDDPTTDFARYVFFESIGVLDAETFDTSGLESTTLGGKEVKVAPENLLEPGENDRGTAYFYDTPDYLFAITAIDAAWAEEVLSQLP